MCAFLPPRWTGPGLNHRKWTKEGGIGRRGQEEIPPPPFSLLCNLLIRFGRTGARHPAPAGRGRASLSGGMRGEAAPPPSLAQSRGPGLSSSSARRGGETRCYKPRPPLPCHSVLPPLRLVASPRGSSVSGVPVPPPVSRVPRGLSAPVLWRCLCPRVRDAALRSQFPSSSGVCMGKSLCQLCSWVMWLGEGWTAGSSPPPLSVGLLAPGVTQ